MTSGDYMQSQKFKLRNIWLEPPVPATSGQPPAPTIVKLSYIPGSHLTSLAVQIVAAVFTS